MDEEIKKMRRRLDKFNSKIDFIYIGTWLTWIAVTIILIKVW